VSTPTAAATAAVAPAGAATYAFTEDDSKVAFVGSKVTGHHDGSSIQAGGDKGATHTITGNLELRGVTKQISFPATIRVATGAVDVNAEFAINRKDFGLSYPGKADDLIRDDVLVKLDVHAKPQKG
jgi:polyisoprenoid-binding protein YceI